MAKREALQELQQRIAHLLQQASTQAGVTASWLGVRLGAQKVLLPLQQSGEIHAVGSIQALPYTKPWFLGVTALRGNVFGVVELSAFIAHDAAAAPPDDRSKHRLVAINEAFGVNVLLRVDGLEGLRARDAFVRSEPAAPTSPAYYGSVFFDAQNQSWQEINLQAMAQSTPFLDIAADMAHAHTSLTH